MSIENTQVIIIKNNQQREAVVQFMLENNISFQSGFDYAGQAYDLYLLTMQYEESSESRWENSGC